MGYERRNGDGVLFKNDRKQQDNQPDYTGNCLINGVEMDIGAWVKTARESGKKFFSLSIRPKQGQDAGQARSAPGAQRRGSPSSNRWNDNDDFLPE